MNMYIAYVCGFLLMGYWLDVWFRSTLFLHIIGLFWKDVRGLDFDEVIERIADKSEYFAELASCEYCLGFWVSLLISFIIDHFCLFGMAWVLVCSTTHPFIYARYNQFIEIIRK